MDKQLLYLVIGEIYVSFYIVYSKHEQYEGHSLYQINVKNIQEITVIDNMVNHLYLDVWSRALPGRPGEILVPKEGKDVFEIALKAVGINYEITVDNIRDLLKLEDRQLRAAAARNRPETVQKKDFKLAFDVVYTYDQINSYLKYVANTFSDTTLVMGGNSYEGRPIYYLKISTTNFEDKRKPIVMLQSLIHSREWVTPSVTLYAINKLVVDKTEPDLINNIDWIIVPVVNPDGYVYTHEKDRLWRKNRHFILTASAACTGVDLNRNFNINWGTASSIDPCNIEFQGQGPTSEPETRVITDILMKYKSRIALFFDIHSFGSMILYAYGNGTLTRNHNTLQLVGGNVAQAIDKIKAAWNPKYIFGNIAHILYNVSGCASDFAQEVGIPLSYSIELPGYKYDNKIAYGFAVDSVSMSQTSFETWEGIATGARYVLNESKCNKTYRHGCK